MKRSGFKSRGQPLQANTGMRKVSKKRAKRRASSEGQADHPLRENAEGKPCTMRLAGCRCDPQYTVLCHIRRNGWGGMGLKPNDALAFFGCDKCHEKEERHHADCTDADILRALGETLLIQIKDGKIKI
jgi:hypothetical protein